MMDAMTKTAVDAEPEIAQFLAITEPFMWTDRMAVTGWFGQYELGGIVKADLVICGPSARDLRAHLLGRAEDMLDALAAAGWQLVQDPFSMEFRTEIRSFLQTLAGVMVQPSEQRGISLTVSLRIGRARA